MGEEGQQGQEETNIPQTGVGFEHSYESDDDCGQQQGLVWELDRERSHVQQQIYLECAQEENSEVVEHLREEIPKYSHVGGQLGHRQDKSVHRVEVAPVPGDVERDELEATEGGQEGSEDGGQGGG